MICYFCASKIPANALACPECGETVLVEKERPTQKNHDPISDIVSEELGFFGFKKKFELAFLALAPCVVVLAIILIPGQNSANRPAPAEDAPVQKNQTMACQIYNQGFESAMSENGSAFGMSLWKNAAADAAQYAEGELAFELQRFARSEGGVDPQLNIAEICNVDAPASGAAIKPEMFLLGYQAAEGQGQKMSNRDDSYYFCNGLANSFYVTNGSSNTSEQMDQWLQGCLEYVRN